MAFPPADISRTFTEVFDVWNASIGHENWQEGLQVAASLGYSKVELWWPWSTPIPDATAISDLTSHLSSYNLSLSALNLWGGNMPEGERGVLHHSALPAEHMDIVEEISLVTGVKKFNLLLGRGGREVTEVQKKHFHQAAEDIKRRTGGTVMAEPLSGMDDYPVRDVKCAGEIVSECGGGVLIDFYHLLMNGVSFQHIEQQLKGLAGMQAQVIHAQWASVPDRSSPRESAGDSYSSSYVPQKCYQLLAQYGYGGEFAAEWL